ncbi:TPA: hypothetical protein ACG8AO_002731, partial [Enterococcus faecium]
LKIILSNLISNAVKYTDVNGVINIGIVNDWLYIENSYGNNKISNMDKIFDVKFDLNRLRPYNCVKVKHQKSH